MVRLRFALLLLAPLAPLRAGEIAPVFFREADAATRRKMDQIAKELGDSTADHRRTARGDFASIGVWAVPRLTEALERGAGRVRVNAALALARIDDPDAAAALRPHTGAADDETRRAACLALGAFRNPADLGVLVDLCANPRQRRGSLAEAALAVGRIPGAAPALAGATVKLPEDERLAAAFVLASALADPAAPLVPHLGHRKDVVQRAAAAGLLLRLRPSDDPAPVLDLLRRGKGDRHTRALLYLALGPLLPSPEVREALLDCATKDREKPEARAFACISLGREWGVAESQAALERALRVAKEDLLAPLMFALVRTGTDAAVDALLKQLDQKDERHHEPAAALLLQMLASVRDGGRHARHDEILDALARHRSDKVKSLADLSVRGAEWPEPFRRLAAERLGAFREAPYDLWTLSWEERAWELVNGILPEILNLDDLPDWGKHTQIKDRQGNPIDDGRKQTSATPWEQDLISFLEERPYFGPGDLR